MGKLSSAGALLAESSVTQLTNRRDVFGSDLHWMLVPTRLQELQTILEVLDGELLSKNSYILNIYCKY